MGGGWVKEGGAKIGIWARFLVRRKAMISGLRPIFVFNAVIIVVFTVNIVFIDKAVTIVILGIKRAGIDVVIGNASSFIFRWSTCSWNKRDCSA